MVQNVFFVIYWMLGELSQERCCPENQEALVEERQCRRWLLLPFSLKPQSFLCIWETLKQLAELLKKTPERHERRLAGRIKVQQRDMWRPLQNSVLWLIGNLLENFMWQKHCIIMMYHVVSRFVSSLDISFIEGYKKQPHTGWGKFFYLHPTWRFKNIFLEFGIYGNMFHAGCLRESFFILWVQESVTFTRHH